MIWEKLDVSVDIKCGRNKGFILFGHVLLTDNHRVPAAVSAELLCIPRILKAKVEVNPSFGWNGVLRADSAEGKQVKIFRV